VNDLVGTKNEGERGEGGASVDENEEEESGWVRD